MTKRITSLLLAILLCISSLMTLSVSAAPSTDYSTEKNYNDVYNGIVDNAKTATMEDISTGFWIFKTYQYTKITPNPTGDPDKVVKVDHYNLANSLNISAKHLEYISVYCKYDGTKTLDNPMMTVMASGKSVTFSSDESIPKDSYGWVNFDVGYAARGKFGEDALTQFHLAPYGEIRSGELASSDVISIQKVKFVSFEELPEEGGEGGTTIPDTSKIEAYNKVHKGVTDKAITATVTEAADNTTVITPNPTGAPDAAVNMDHFGLSIALPELKYISFYCKYDGTKTLPRAQIRLLGHNGKYLTENVTVTANEDLSKDGYAWINFDVGCAAYGKITSTTLYQFHFYPYGETPSGELDTSDVISIQKIRYVKNGDIAGSGIVGIYPMSFTRGREDVKGTDPETVYVKVGDLFKLPQNPYSRENYTFNGWLCSADNQVYQPGDKYTVTERERVGSALLKNITGEALFYPDWTIIDSNTTLPDVFSVEYTDYHNGFLGNKNYFTATKNFDFLGRRTVKLEVKTDSSDALLLDAWSWHNMPFDLDKYNYATITYYADTDVNLSGATPYINFHVSSVEGTPAPLTGAVVVHSDKNLVNNKWGVMGFDLSAVKAKLNPNTDKHILKQFHLYLTGHTSTSSDKIIASDFQSGDAFYMDTLTLYAEKPAGDFRIQQGVLNGDGNGNIRPNDSLTRAEAAQIILNTFGNEKASEYLAKLPSDFSKFENTFSDVKSTDWFYLAVLVMDTLGVLPEDGLFRPNDPITVAEFMRWMFFIEKDGMNGVSSFTGDAGSTKPITRAQAVMLLSDWHTNGIPDQLTRSRVKIFNDLSIDSPEYLAFMNIGATRLSSFDESGNETIYQLICPGSKANSLEYNTASTAEYIRELDRYEAQRIEEIRNTESQYTVKSYGKVYYVSSSEGTTTGGSSADNPKLVSTLTDVSNMSLANGDVVLFKRGDLFRGKLTTKAGVTYSAYGEGPKPRLYRSEKNHTGAENWTVHYQDTETNKTIWKTAYTVSQDVGAIIINNGNIVGLKEIPSYLNGGYYVRGMETDKFDTNGNQTVWQKEFVLINELDNNHEFFHDLGGTNTTASGYIYFRCDEGNPGELYESIEMNQKTNLIAAASNVTIDNLCLMYFGSHGIGSGTVSNLTVTNCEIGWGGGSIQHYTNGKVTRFGNGIEIYGGLVNYTIDNCYVYQIYDAGITHQISTTSAGNYYMKNVVYSNNVLCDSTYNIEYFMSNDGSNETSERFMENILFENNLIRRAGYGWGQQRPDDAPAGIKGWTHNNYAANTIIRGNIIDRCYNHTGGQSHLIQLGTKYNGSTAYLDGNTFIQVPERYFALNNRNDYKYNRNVKDYIDIIGGKDNKVLYADEDYGDD